MIGSPIVFDPDELRAQLSHVSAAAAHAGNLRRHRTPRVPVGALGRDFESLSRRLDAALARVHEEGHNRLERIGRTADNAIVDVVRLAETDSGFAQRFRDQGGHRL